MSSLNPDQNKLQKPDDVPRNVKKSDCDMFEETAMIVLKETEQSLLVDKTSTDPLKEASPMLSKSTELHIQSEIDQVSKLSNLLGNETTVNKDSNVEEQVNAENCQPIHSVCKIIGDDSSTEVTPGSKPCYTEMKSDYTLRPYLPDMDWANCSWADPDDSL